MKYDPPRAVKVLKIDPSVQYVFDDFKILPELAEKSEITRSADYSKDETIKILLETCSFLSYCNEHKVNLPEPYWFAMLSNLCRIPGGRDLIHTLSRGYPKYSKDETDKKILHVRNDSGPITCTYIKTFFDCGQNCGVKSPINLLHSRKKATFEIVDLPKNHYAEEAWATKIAKQTFYGLAGDFVNLIEPETEADPAALMVQFLAAFGNVIGKEAYFQVGAIKHYFNLFTVLVGKSSRGRKGTALDVVKGSLINLDPNWTKERIKSGLSTGEGLIWEVRDPIRKKEEIKDRGRATGEYQEVLIDAGVEDKRLLVTQTEFASILRIMERDGNTLSSTLRQAWDSEILNTMTKNNPAIATGAHISIIGHITRDEVRRYLGRTEIANGFANRFIWIMVKRSKSLPEGGEPINSKDFNQIIERFHKAIDFAKTAGCMSKDEETKKHWAEIYSDLSSDKPGLWGAVISRSEAQVLRLSCIYALLDLSKVVKLEHLMAALAIWDYAEVSVKHIFGNATGDSLADQILLALQNSPDGLTRTEISNLFGRNKDKEQLDRSLAFLSQHGLIEMVKVTKKETGGRPIERWVVKN